MRWVVLLSILAFASPARADDVDDLVAKGEALAKESEFTSAIEAFKAADVKRPRAKHACLIGLVYTRRELWPQAELFFARCRERATADDPLPKWIDQAQEQLVGKLTAAGAAPVTIVVKPPTARITVSSFAPDEVFGPQTIHLAPGRHTIDAAADGYVASSREVVVSTSEPQTVSITLRSDAEVAAAAAAPPLPKVVVPLPPPPSPRSSVPTIVVLGGVGLGLAAGAFQLFVYKPARDRLASAPDEAIYNARIASFKDRRDVTIGLYAGAALAVATGLVLRYTVFGRRESPVAIGAMVDQHGGMVSLAWSR